MAEIVNRACVIVAASHNPTILNPDWLLRMELVPEDWELIPPAISTPVLSQVRYQNGVSVMFEPSKLSVILDGEGVDGPPIADLVNRIVLVLPHVPYTGVGINFHAVEELESAGRILREKVIIAGPWHSEERTPSQLSAKFTYAVEDTMSLNVTVTSMHGVDESSEPPVEKDVLTFDANFHSDLIPDSEIVPQITDVLESFDEKQSEFLDYMQDFLRVLR